MLRGIHNFDERLRAALRILTKVDILESNRKLIFKFHNFLLADGISKARVVRYVSGLKQFAEMVDKCFSEMSKDDVIGFIGEIESRNYTNWTKVTYKTMFKKFMTWIAGSDEPPESVKWISIKHKRVKRLPEEILTQEEVKKLIECATNVRDRAFIAALYDSGCRVGEIGNLQIKHLQFDKYGAVLMVNGKTGQRRVRVIMCTPYLAEWLDKHPKRGPEAPLWVSLPPNDGRQLDYRSLKKGITKAARLAGVTKRVNPHAFRHARATHLCSHLTEAQMKEYFGWTQDSSMASVYIHLSGRDVDNALLRISGINVPEDRVDKPLSLINCTRCRHNNSPTSKYCNRCGLILDIKDAIELEEMNKEKDKLLDLLVNDPDVKQLLMEKARLVRNG